MIDFLEKLKGKGCAVIYTEEGLENLFLEKNKTRKLLRTFMSAKKNS